MAPAPGCLLCEDHLGGPRGGGSGSGSQAALHLVLLRGWGLHAGAPWRPGRTRARVPSRPLPAGLQRPAPPPWSPRPRPPAPPQSSPLAGPVVRTEPDRTPSAPAGVGPRPAPLLSPRGAPGTPGPPAGPAGEGARRPGSRHAARCPMSVPRSLESQRGPVPGPLPRRPGNSLWVPTWATGAQGHLSRTRAPPTDPSAPDGRGPGAPAAVSTPGRLRE